MNKQPLTLVSVLSCLALVFSIAGINANADEIPDPDMTQKEQIEHMHHQLHEDQAPYKEKEMQALKELNEMTVREGVAAADIEAKIDELMEAKTHIMRLRYGHLVEMRTILTDEQKVGYDKGVLARSEVR